MNIQYSGAPLRLKKSTIGLAILALTGTALLNACAESAEQVSVGAVQQVTKTVERYEVIQTLSAQGKTVLGGTQTGVVTVSTDGGSSWLRQRVSSTASFIDSAFCPDGSAAMLDVYNTVWTSSGDFKDWLPSKFDKPSSPVAIECHSSGLWVVGSGSNLINSTDQGKTWRVVSFDEDAQFTALTFTSDTHGIAFGEFGMLAFTNDGGQTWQRGEPIAGDFYTYDTLFTDANTGYATGLAGQVLSTIDGGTSWVRMGNTTEAPLYRLFMHAGAPHGVGANGTLARLEGDQWVRVAYDSPVLSFLGAAVSGSQSIVVGGPGGLLRTVQSSNSSQADPS
ncbi:YCF48-related protein [uncultured Limnobacter sp.]|uniref:WD40/YVTN/BNR-like repeat-containing protein n=1 Tax=uncultured Limnobacter sp. TaxID=199681 RepID=UPI0030FCE1E9